MIVSCLMLAQSQTCLFIVLALLARNEAPASVNMGMGVGGMRNDSCGVCGGDSSTCAGCDGVPNSGLGYDACLVCGGNGESCAGCDDVPRANPKQDFCSAAGSKTCFAGTAIGTGE